MLSLACSHADIGVKVETQAALDEKFRTKLEEDKEPQSVIHIPTGFGKFVSTTLSVSRHVD
jgi:hypothetical protein